MSKTTKTRDEELEEMMGGAVNTSDPFAGDDPAQVEDEETVIDITQEVVRAGNYHGRVIEATKGLSNAGNNQWTLKIEFPQINRSLDYFLTLSAKTMWKSGKALRALGVPVEQQGDRTIARFKRSDLLGKLCIGAVDNEEYQGDLRPKCQTILPADAGTVKLFAEL